MALPTMRKDGSEPPSPKHNASVWILVLAAICGSITLLVLLGMPVAAAVVAVPTLAVVANQVVGHLNGSPSEEKPPAPPKLPDAKNHAA
ncbi:hypothetical protein ACFQ1I_46410 [Kitasatospora arboriphila]